MIGQLCQAWGLVDAERSRLGIKPIVQDAQDGMQAGSGRTQHSWKEKKNMLEVPSRFFT